VGIKILICYIAGTKKPVEEYSLHKMIKMEPFICGSQIDITFFVGFSVVIGLAPTIASFLQRNPVFLQRSLPFDPPQFYRPQDIWIPDAKNSSR